MTLKEFCKLKFLSNEYKIMIDTEYGIIDYDSQCKISNIHIYLNEEILNSEILLVQPIINGFIITLNRR